MYMEGEGERRGGRRRKSSTEIREGRIRCK
jgi:hypothetical protein